MSTASATWGSSSDVGTVPVWPPPSAPWAMTASTPHAATFSAWRRAPTVGITTTPRVLELLHESLARRLGEARDAHALADDQLDPVVDVGLVGAQVHAERLVGALLHLVDRGPQLVERHRRRREDAERTRRARGRGEPRARRPSPCPSARSGTRPRTARTSRRPESCVASACVTGSGHLLARRSRCGSTVAG